MPAIWINHNPRNGQPYFNTSLFSPNALGTQGNASRRSFFGPGMDNYDIALHKTTKFAESRTLEIRFEMFNSFNHAQFFGPNAVNGNIDGATFGYDAGGGSSYRASSRKVHLLNGDSEPSRGPAARLGPRTTRTRHMQQLMV